MAELTKQLDINHRIAMQRRVNNSISLSTIDSFNELVNSYPEFL